MNESFSFYAFVLLHSIRSSFRSLILLLFSFSFSFSLLIMLSVYCKYWKFCLNVVVVVWFTGSIVGFFLFLFFCLSCLSLFLYLFVMCVVLSFHFFRTTSLFFTSASKWSCLCDCNNTHPCFYLCIFFHFKCFMVKVIHWCIKCYARCSHIEFGNICI